MQHKVNLFIFNMFKTYLNFTVPRFPRNFGRKHEYLREINERCRKHELKLHVAMRMHEELKKKKEISRSRHQSLLCFPTR